jgi:hypothetical protein
MGAFRDPIPLEERAVLAAFTAGVLVVGAFMAVEAGDSANEEIQDEVGK